MLTSETMVALLRRDVVPSLGCTEPVCVAVAAADAAAAVGGKIRSISVAVSPGIYKNGMAVGIPSCDRVGLPYAAALGALLGNAGRGLEILEGITPALAVRAVSLVESGSVEVAIDAGESGVFARCFVRTEKGEGLSVIRGGHTNIVLTQANGVDRLRRGCDTVDLEDALLGELATMTIAEMRALASAVPFEDIAFMLEGVALNDDAVASAATESYGVGVAATLSDDLGGAFVGDDLMSRIMLAVSSSIEHRLDGSPHAVMSSAGAGSKGLALILPIAYTARAVQATREQTARALVFGHLVNSFINYRIGKLSALCSCGLAASTAAAAAMTWLFGGDDERIGWAIRNMTGTLTGMICDGGSVGCSLKLATASAAALLCARMAANGVALRESDGICAITPEACIANMSRIANPGMVRTDEEILSIMQEKATR